MGTSDLAGHVVVARDVRSRRLHELLGHLDPGAPRRGIVERRIPNRNDRVGIVAGINDDLRGLSLRLRIVPMWTSLALVAVIPSAVVMLGIVVEYIPNGYVVPLSATWAAYGVTLLLPATKALAQSEAGNAS